MLTKKTDNKEVMTKLLSLLDEINFRVNAFNEIAKADLDEKTVEFVQDLIIYDLHSIMDDHHAVFPFF